MTQKDKIESLEAKINELKNDINHLSKELKDAHSVIIAQRQTITVLQGLLERAKNDIRN